MEKNKIVILCLGFFIFFIFFYSYSLITAVVTPILNFSSGAAIYSSMVVSNGSLYFGSLDNSTYQLNASNFQHIANYTTGGEIWSTPAVFNNSVYIGNDAYVFYQLNASNISQYIANYTTEGTIHQTSSAIANGYIYIGSSDKQFYQLNASNLSQKIANYTALKNSPFVNSPAVANDSVYIAENNAVLYQLNASNVSQQITNYTLLGTIYSSSPTVANGSVYQGDYGGHLFQLNASNISQHISNYTTKGGILYSSPAVANDYVYIGSNGCVFYQLNASNISQQIANYTTYNELVENCWASPIVAGNYVYVGNENNTFYQLNASNVSQQIANYTTAGRIFSAPAIEGNYVYVGDNSGRVYQLNKSNVASETAIFTLVDCEVSWSCTAWSSCFASQQTRTCKDANLCGITTSKPAESQTCSSGGGLIGGVSQTSAILSISPSEPAIMEITNNYMSARRITVNVNNPVSDVSLTIKEVNASSAGFGIGFSGIPYEAFEITTMNLSNDNIENATIEFRVNKTKLSESNFTINDVFLYRKPVNTTEWIPLNTTYLLDEDGYSRFSAVSPGFSTFMIFISKEECIPSEKRCFENQVQFCLGNKKWLVSEVCDYKCINGKCVDKGLQINLNPLVVYPIIGIVVVGVLVSFLAQRMPKQKKSNGLTTSSLYKSFGKK